MSVTPITQFDVIAVAPQLDCKLMDGAWDDVLAYVNQFDMSPLWETPTTIRLARILLAAHIGTVAISAAGGQTGPVTSQSAGPLRVSYGQMSASASTVGYNLSEYGQQYLSILQASAANGPLLI